MADRISVDEPLISTDVDTLIKAIAYKKDVDVSQLATKTSIDQTTVEKWLRILEEEGYININYNLTNMRISWIKQDSDSKHADTPVPVEKSEPVMPVNAPLTRPEIKLVDNTPPSATASEPKIPILSEPQPQQKMQDLPTLLEEELKRESVQAANPMEQVLSSHDVKFNILKEMEKDWESDGQPETANSQESPNAVNSNPRQVPEKQVDAKPISPTMTQESARPTVKEEQQPIVERVQDVTPPTYKKEVAEERALPASEQEQAVLRQNVNEYLEQISQQRKLIIELKAEKEEMYGKKLLPLENKFETVSITFSEKILEKEERILSLKDKLVQLPARYTEIERLKSSIQKIEYDSTNTLEQARTNIDGILGDIKKKESETNARMTSGLAALEGEKARLTDIENVARGITAKVEKIEVFMKDTQSNIDQLFQSMKTLEDDLALARRKQEEVISLADEARVAIDSREDELEGLKTHIDELRGVEQWVEDYVKDYDRKLKDIHNLVSESKEELALLEETAEIEQLKNYLDELETITELYAEETQHIAQEERSIDRRINDAQEKLAVLITESRNLIKRLRKDVKGTTYNITMDRAETTVEKIKSVVEEKQKEREQISDEIAKKKTARSVKKDSKTPPKKGGKK